MSKLKFFERETPVAIKQMDLTDDYEMFFVSTIIDVVEGLDEKADELEKNDVGLMNFSESLDVVKSCIKRASLPDGFRLVGLWINREPDTIKYGVVDLRSVDYK